MDKDRDTVVCEVTSAFHDTCMILFLTFAMIFYIWVKVDKNGYVTFSTQFQHNYWSKITLGVKLWKTRKSLVCHLTSLLAIDIHQASINFEHFLCVPRLSLLERYCLVDSRNCIPRTDFNDNCLSENCFQKTDSRKNPPTSRLKISSRKNDVYLYLQQL